VVCVCVCAHVEREERSQPHRVAVDTWRGWQLCEVWGVATHPLRVPYPHLPLHPHMRETLHVRVCRLLAMDLLEASLRYMINRPA